tara:strand:+ start:14538 stop:15641 length:1104 start_codon:yes stop_codon:yes gene_type:complete
MRLNKIIVFISFIFLFCCSDLNQQLVIAGKNKKEINTALSEVPKNQLEGMKWLVKHMPDQDLKTVTSEFLIENCNLAYKAWKESPWGHDIPDSIFYEYILPFANLNEKRDDWRKDFYNRFFNMTKDASSSYEAATIINNKMFDAIGVKYSTKRLKADQSPYESMASGLASCTGLSFLLIDACRSIGVPARFVGTPLWYNNSGNHSWVEIWDNGWHFTGAYEPTGHKLNEGWFSNLAARAVEGHSKYGIYAATWGESDLFFPMNWLPNVKTYNAIDITSRYITNIDSNLVPIKIRAVDSNGKRQQLQVKVKGGNNFYFEGFSKDETCDFNDHLTLMLPKGENFTIKVGKHIQKIRVKKEEIIDLKLIN